MWAQVLNDQLISIISRPKSLVINNVTYPKQIFSKWSDSERKEIGIVPYVYTGSHKNEVFYTNAEAPPVVEGNQVSVNRSSTGKDVGVVKSEMKANAAQTLASLLSQTDWVVIRATETSKAAPTKTAAWRAALRKKLVDLEALIDAKTDIAGLEALTVLTQAEADAGKESSVFYDWPEIEK